ncbi:MAG: hypothetical protein HY278_08040 [candidate division NC10 bacterium]|nr:hypothetical protein [candidate division NC10 bacterium]
MGTAEGMRNLTQQIANAFEARVARVADLRQETAAKLKGFRQGMKNVQHELRRKAADLRRFLGTTESSRLRDFQEMHEGIQAGQEVRSRQLGGMLAGCREMVSGIRREREAAVGHWQSMAVALAWKRGSASR